MTKHITNTDLIDRLDKALPQTQCGLCSYGACRPYAQAMAKGEATINLCPPGGVATLHALSHILTIDSTPFISEMAAKTKTPSVAVIREADCIGCTKCIQACPVDAIIGSAKKMHTVLTQDCTGCELCVEPCPVDCIDLIQSNPTSAQESQRQAQHWRQRYHRHLQRLANEQRFDKRASKPNTDKIATTQARQRTIQEALTRVMKRKPVNEREKTS